jgi:hypothetical protein
VALRLVLGGAVDGRPLDHDLESVVTLGALERLIALLGRGTLCVALAHALMLLRPRAALDPLGERVPVRLLERGGDARIRVARVVDVVL